MCIALYCVGGGHYNHSLFWKWMAPPGSCSSTISGSLKNLIEEKWGSVDQMKKEFTQAAIKRFGSGWAWLGVAQNGKLDIVSTANQGNACQPTIIFTLLLYCYYLFLSIYR